MAVLFVALGAIAVGLITVAILSSLATPRMKQFCEVVILEKRRFNTCVKEKGHEGCHICADGKRF